MKVNLFRPREYTFVWPTDEIMAAIEGEKIPETERITFHCKRLGHAAKRQIEDNMMNFKGSQKQQRGKKAPTINKISMNYAIGTTKDSQLRGSVQDWENVLDDDGKPIKFNWDNLQLLLECNAGLDPETYGILERDLLEKIQKENSFVDSTTVSGKN